MAIKQRVLTKLNALGNYVLQVMNTGKSETLSNIYSELNAARDLCRRGLPNDSYVAYDEFYDGLILAVQQMIDVTRPQKDVLLLCKELLRHLIIETKKERHFKKEIVFLPYKASMWDSMESIWMAAHADRENCIAYVVPIPYCDRNSDGSVAEWHCEREHFPGYVPTLNWRDLDIAALHPDVVFIHNPYDGNNLVTSVDGSYYSSNLRPHTDLLLYVPYYVTTGGMVEGTSPIWPYVDYLIVQSASFERFYETPVPVEKLAPLGSPKLDRVIRLCNNPPKPPKQWRKKLGQKKVYFYNTSLGGMLLNVDLFLKKMEYVFRIFAKRKDVCLIWRPHPLMLATLSSMRPKAVSRYEELKDMFLRENIGIYDDTPDIENTIAVSDIYVGDGGTSVTMLFAIVGKPMFILNDNIHELPTAEDWRGELLTEATFQGQDDWIVTPTNRLYKKEGNGSYRHVCPLCEYHAGSYYLKVIEAEGKAYVCPACAQDILIVSENGIEERIPLKREIGTWGAFAQAWRVGHYIFLIPLLYPNIVRFDLRTKEIAYLEGQKEHFVKKIHGEWRIGGSCVWKGELLIASPDSAEVLHVDAETLETEIGIIGESNIGCVFMCTDDEDIWLIPSSGFNLCRWRPETGEVKEYSVRMDGLYGHYPLYKTASDAFLFGMPAFDEDYVYLPPFWGNHFVKVDKHTGNAMEWDIPLPADTKGKSDYFAPLGVAGFVGNSGNGHWRMFYWPERKLYDVDVRTGDCQEINILMDKDALRHEVVGFTEQTDWMCYACQENSFHTLQDFLDGKLPGEPHDRERQLRDYQKIVVNHDGTAGEKIYHFALEKLSEKEEQRVIS